MTRKFSAEVRERAVRMVRERESEYPSRWNAIVSIAPKIRCTSETLRLWVRHSERESLGPSPGETGDVAERLVALERENRELRHTNEILRNASVYLRAGLEGVEAVEKAMEPASLET